MDTCDDSIRIPWIDPAHTEVATSGGRRIDRESPPDTCGKRNLQFKFIGECGRPAQAPCYRLEADIAVAKNLIGPKVVTRLAQPAHARAHNVTSIGPQWA